MEPIVEKIVVAVLSHAAGATLTPIGKRIATAIWGGTKTPRASDIQKLLEQLANASGPAIRSLVEQAAKERHVPKQEAEDLIQLLVNLSRNARFHTTNGTKFSAVVQAEKLIEKLLANFQPKRVRGEPVSPHSDWILDQFLGMGGFGEVWRAKNSLFHGARAFKFFTDPEHQEWLKKEGQALARVKEELGNHPNIVQYIDIATQATPFPYLALDFANNGSLEDWIDQPASEQIDLNVDELMSNVIDGLCEAHGAQIYHRDIKPANILLNYDEHDGTIAPLIADFGLSRADKASAAGARTSAVSSQEIVVGTQMYLPPEATSYGGMGPGQQDVFALGVTWYQLLVSKIERPPYDFADQLRQMGIETRTIRLLSRCLSQPSRRFRDAIELKRAFEDVDSTGLSWPIPEGCFDVSLLTYAAFERMAKA